MKTIIVYSTMTGTTEFMAEQIAVALTEAGYAVDIAESTNTSTHELAGYDLILIGANTWDEGDLWDEMIDFYEELPGVDLTGKKGAVFGAGDSFYEHFATAVDTMEEALKKQGCELLLDGLKVDVVPDEEIETACKDFARKLDLRCRELGLVQQ
ncbi:flavodoxin [Heyndrickxia coagulans]|uniref:flavodoxin n=1 Tax=Heyndrickxia coagulans TaxID=1398 RepID=UPI0018A7D637|nr:flavodoxin [Heyndrickxia coagulans]MBF8418486.1 flavodoxin [Heyndrickxia coagulans]